jgi:hypothetical protein
VVEQIRIGGVLKSFRTISSVNVQLITNVPEISSVSIIRVDLMMKEISQTLFFKWTLTRLMARESSMFIGRESFKSHIHYRYYMRGFLDALEFTFVCFWKKVKISFIKPGVR